MIARRYRTRVSYIVRLNNLRSAHRIRAGKYIIVPIQGAAAEVASAKPQYKNKRRTINKDALEKQAKRAVAPPDHKKTVYLVKDGDTLGEIAQLHQMSVRELRSVNEIRGDRIYPGQTLKVRPLLGDDSAGLGLLSPEDITRTIAIREATGDRDGQCKSRGDEADEGRVLS